MRGLWVPAVLLRKRKYLFNKEIHQVTAQAGPGGCIGQAVRMPPAGRHGSGGPLARKKVEPAGIRGGGSDRLREISPAKALFGLILARNMGPMEGRGNEARRRFSAELSGNRKSLSGPDDPGKIIDVAGRNVSFVSVQKRNLSSNSMRAIRGS